MTKLEKLSLSEQYAFEVNVQYENDTYAGELFLTPDSIKLEIMGEDRNKDTGIMRDFRSLADIGVLRAYKGDDNFLLYGIKHVRGVSKTLNRLKGKGFFKIVLEIDYVIFSRYHLLINQEFCSFSIYSSSIQRLIGRTFTQERLLEENSPGEEFLVITDEVVFCYAYDYRSSHDSTKKIEEICPHLFGQMMGTLIEFLAVINDLFTVFSFLNGSELEIEEIILRKEGGLSSLDSSLYYPTNRFLKPRAKTSAFFSWHANRGNYIDSCGFKDSHLTKYFSLENTEKSYFSKYLRYKRVDSVEERFLGYFRVLESCCRKDGIYVDFDILESFIGKTKDIITSFFPVEKKQLLSLVQRLKKLNRQKYNTETCIQRLMSSIDGIDWVYSKIDVKRICDLRNDITHANDYSLDEIEPMTNFIESLLVFSLLRLIDVSEVEIVKVLSRLDVFKRVIKHAS